MYSIRKAISSDAAAVSALVCGLVGDSLVDSAGVEAEGFLRTLTPEEICKAMVLPNRSYAVAVLDTEVCGMIMIRDTNYVGQFFVRAEHQGKGMGSALWRFALANALAAGGSGEFTVRSSVAAEPVYRRLGFEPTGPVELQQGFRFVPMRRVAASAAP